MPELLPIHLRTGLRALGFRRSGAPIYPIMGGADDGTAKDGDQGGQGDPNGGGTDQGANKGDAGRQGAPEPAYPANTPLTEMTVEQREAYWKAAARRHEATAKARGDYDEQKAKAAELDTLKAANQTEQEKAVAAARDEARAEGARSVAPQLVEAHFLAASAGRLEPDVVREILAPLNVDHFLTDKGQVDTAKVTAYVNQIAPATGAGTKTPLGPSSHGQGRRESTAKPSVESGRALYEARHPQKIA